MHGGPVLDLNTLSLRNKRASLFLSFLILSILVLAAFSFRHDLFPTFSVTANQAKSEPKAAKGGAPFYFVKNKGQLDKQVKYYAAGAGYNFFLTKNSVTYSLKGEGAAGYALKVKFSGANPNVEPRAGSLLGGKVNYLVGERESEWKTNIPIYGNVTMPDIYPGVDLTYKEHKKKLKYEFRVAPKANYTNIKMVYAGARSVRLDKQGNLLVGVPGGKVKDPAPIAYQEENGKRTAVDAGFSVEGSTVGFWLGAYNPNLPVIIDPGLTYSTFLGGSKQDWGLDVDVDGAGNAYVTGYTYSLDFPVTAGAFKGSFSDAFIAKLNPSGSSLIYATVLGGTEADGSQGIEVDGSGNAFIAGYTRSSDFPKTAGGYVGREDVFVAKINPSGDAVVYARVVGGAADDHAHDLAIDANGNAYVTGETKSANFPTSAGAFDTGHNGGIDIFLTKLNSAGTALVYSTYMGVVADDIGRAVAVDAGGNAYVTGWTFSTNFPTTAGAYDRSQNGERDTFVTKMNSTGKALVYSTFVGGRDWDEAFGLDIDGSGNAYITGETKSTNFPTTSGSFRTNHNGGYDAFVTKLNSSGTGLSYSTFLGGNENDYGFGIEVDGAGNAHVVGLTYAGTFPTTIYAFDASHNGGGDVFVSKLSSEGTYLKYSTFLGGYDYDWGEGITVDGGGIYVVGGSYSSDFPVTVGAFDTNLDRPDAFVSKISRQDSGPNDPIGGGDSGGGGSDPGGGGSPYPVYYPVPYPVPGGVSPYTRLGPRVVVNAPFLSTKISKRNTFKVTWGSKDLPAGVAPDTYTVKVRPANSSTWKVWKKNTRESSALFKGQAGRTYYFRAKGVDSTGKIRWSRVDKTIVPYNESWHLKRMRGFRGFQKLGRSQRYLSSIVYSDTRWDTLKYTFHGNSVGLIVTMAENRGRAQIFIDDKHVKTVDAFSNRTKYRQKIIYHTWPKEGRHSLKVVALGTPGRSRFDVDAIAVGRGEI